MLSRGSVIAFLAHFCDNHGPKVVLCTTSERRLVRQSDLGGRGSQCCPLPPTVVRRSSSARRRADRERNRLVDARRPPCEGCRSLGDDVRFLASRDDCWTYVSGNLRAVADRLEPLSERRLKTLAARCLSVEEPAQSSSEPDEDDARELLFSDDGMVYSRAFKLVDSSHRGGRRAYCVAVVSADRHALVERVHFLNDRVGSLVSELKAAAAVAVSVSYTTLETALETPSTVISERRVVHPPQKNLSAITFPDVYNTLHSSFAEIISGLEPGEVQMPITSHQQQSVQPPSLRIVTAQLDPEKFGAVLTALLTAAEVELSSKDRPALDAVFRTLNACLPAGLGRRRARWKLVQASGGLHQVVYPGIAGLSTQKMKARVDCGNDALSLNVSCLGVSPHPAVPPTVRKILHYAYNDSADDEFVVAGIKAVVSDCEALGLNLSACDPSASAASAKVFCRKLGLSERDEAVVRFFAHQRRL